MKYSSIWKSLSAAALIAAASVLGVAAWAGELVCAIAQVGGSADMLLNGAWAPAKTGTSLPGGTQLRTGADGEIVLAFSDATKLRLGRASSFTLDEVGNSSVKVSTTLGLLEAWVKKMRGRAFEVKSPTAVAAVRGTVFSFNVASGGNTEIQLFQGRLSIADNFGHSLTLGPRQVYQATTSGAAPAPKPLPPGVSAPSEPPVAAPRAAGGPPPPGGPDKGEVSGDLPPAPPPPTAAQNVQAGVSGSAP